MSKTISTEIFKIFVHRKLHIHVNTLLYDSLDLLIGTFLTQDGPGLNGNPENYIQLVKFRGGFPQATNFNIIIIRFRFLI